MGKASRIKGNSLERKVAKAFSKTFYDDETVLRRTPLSGGWGTKYAVGDCAGPEDFKLYIECRNREVWSASALFNSNSILYKWYKEIVVEARKYDREAVLVFTRNYEDVFIMTRIYVDGICPQMVYGEGSHAIYIFRLTRWLEKVDKHVGRKGDDRETSQ